MSYKPTAYVQRLMNKKPSPIMEGWMKYHARINEVINLATAENHLLYDFLKPLMADRSDYKNVDFTYNDAFSKQNLTKAFADLYEKHFGMKNVDPSRIMFGSGIAYLVEICALVFCEPGDRIMIPKPCYSFFEPDMKSSGAIFDYIDLENLPDEPPADARILLLTNPGNPEGDIIPDQDKVFKWAKKNPNLHVLVDEVYALSVRDGSNFVSMFEHPEADPMRTHHLYGVSKDWGLAGLHVGVFYTRDNDVFKAMSDVAGRYSLPSDTKNFLEKIFCNYELRDRMITEMKKRLIERENQAIKIFEEGKVPYKKYPASLFIMLDMTEIVHNTEEEMKVYLDFMDRFDIMILPGALGFQCKTPGWFRLCFSAEENNLIEGCKRIVKGFNTMKEELAKK